MCAKIARGSNLANHFCVGTILVDKGIPRAPQHKDSYLTLPRGFALQSTLSQRRHVSRIFVKGYGLFLYRIATLVKLHVTRANFRLFSSPLLDVGSGPSYNLCQH